MFSFTLPSHIDESTIRRGDFVSADHPALGSTDPASEWLGMRVSEFGSGYVKAHMTVRKDMLNGFSICHGGMIFAFADTALAWASNDPDDLSLMTVTQGVDVNFLRSAREGSELTAIGIKSPTSRRSGLCDVTVFDEQSLEIAVFRGRYRSIPRT